MKTWLWLAGIVVISGLIYVGRTGSGSEADRDRVRYSEIRREVFAQEQQSQRNIPAHQILFELGWIESNTRDQPRFHERLNALESAVHDPANLRATDAQSPTSGAWGQWYTEWVFKLDASYEQIAQLASEGRLPKYPCRFLDRINSPENLTAHLNHLLTSEPDVDGINRRRELNETVSDLLRLIHRHLPADYAYHPQLDATLLDWLMNTARDPVTGYWGGWYRRNGKIEKTQDLSVTFHIVSYLDGAVPDWPKIIDTTLAIKDRKYPTGWLSSNAFLNHNNMDVVRIFELGWSHASASQRAMIRVELQKMLDWCLRESLRPDGSFVVTDEDDSLETTLYFGTVFLARLGYFDRSRRFWTDADFPKAAEDRAHIVQFIRNHYSTGGEGGTYYRSALAALGEPPPSP